MPGCPRRDVSDGLHLGLRTAASVPRSLRARRSGTPDSVFTGVVTAVTRPSDEPDQHRHIRRLRSLSNAGSGVSKARLSSAVDARHKWSPCIFRFDVGRRYIVYASRDADGALSAGKCSGTKLLDDAEADLDYAERLPCPGTGGSIYGSVTRRQPDFVDDWKSTTLSPGNISVTVRDSAGAAVKVRADADGRFEVTGLRPGTYSVSVDLPATTRALRRPAERSNSKNARACRLAFTFSRTDGLQGRLWTVRGGRSAGYRYLSCRRNSRTELTIHA